MNFIPLILFLVPLSKLRSRLVLIMVSVRGAPCNRIGEKKQNLQKKIWPKRMKGGRVIRPFIYHRVTE